MRLRLGGGDLEVLHLHIWTFSREFTRGAVIAKRIQRRNAYGSRCHVHQQYISFHFPPLSSDKACIAFFSLHVAATGDKPVTFKYFSL